MWSVVTTDNNNLSIPCSLLPPQEWPGGGERNKAKASILLWPALF